MKATDFLQWIGAAFIIAGHILNAIGPSVYPWNIVAFTLGGIVFMAWTIIVRNMPQMTVNVVALSVCFYGLYTAWAK